MNFKDTWATNEDGEQFVFTVEMQRRLSEAGLPIEPESLALLDDAPAEVKPPRRERQRPQKKEPEPRRDDAFEEPAAIQIDPNTGKYIGRIKWYNKSKGYGFIARGGTEQIFFHRTDINCDPDDLKDGTWVLYDVEETPKGFEANEVELFEEGL